MNKNRIRYSFELAHRLCEKKMREVAVKNTLKTFFNAMKVREDLIDKMRDTYERVLKIKHRMISKLLIK
jgi:Txe/YoeB family toxin of Txe-Axe toxin-antitoxin module